MKKLLTVIGTNDYVVCNYDKYEKCRFIQEAIIKKHQDIEEVVIFATKEAIEKNWITHKDKKDEKDLFLKYVDYIGLEDTLKNLQNEYKFNYKLVDINEGYNEEEIWKNFSQIYNYVNENDELYIDVTHGFRYLPYLMMTIINYLKLMKNVDIKSIEYGIFEKLGPAYLVRQKIAPEDRNAEIMSLDYLDELNEWVSGTEMLLYTGDTTKIKKMINNSKEIEDVKFNSKIKKIIEAIDKFDIALKTCRGYGNDKINKYIIEIKKKFIEIEEYNNENDENIVKILSLLKKMKLKYEPFYIEEEKEIENNFIVVKWCIEHNLIQQGFTILQENIVSFFERMVGINELDKQKRMIIAEAMSYKAMKILINDNIENKSENYAKEEDKILFNKVLEKIENQYEDVIKVYYGIIQKRNDINHFGKSKDATTGLKLKESLKDFMEKTEINIC